MASLTTLVMALVLLLVSAALMEGVRYVKKKAEDWNREGTSPFGTR